MLLLVWLVMFFLCEIFCFNAWFLVSLVPLHSFTLSAKTDSDLAESSLLN